MPKIKEMNSRCWITNLITKIAQSECISFEEVGFGPPLFIFSGTLYASTLIVK